MFRRVLVIGSFLSLAVSPAVGADVSSSPAKLTAEHVIEKNVAERGVQQAWRADEMKAAEMQADLDGPLVDYAVEGTNVELEGTEKVEGNDTYRLKLTFKNGQAQRVWVDAKTFLETKIEGTPRRLDGKYHPVEVYYRDYRAVSGLMMAHVMETKVPGVKQTEKIEIEKVVVNPRMEDSRFAKLQ